MTLPLPANWATGQEFTAADEDNVEAAVNALGDGTLTIPRRVKTSAASTLTLTAAYNVYIYTGSAATTWILPTVAGNTGVVLDLFNRGTALVTLNCPGSDKMYNQGAVATIPLPVGSSLRLINDGAYWIVLSASKPTPLYDNSANSGYTAAVASGTATTFNQVVAEGEPYGIVAVIASASTTVVPGTGTPNVQFGSVTLDPLGSINANNTSGAGFIWVFGGKNIPSGTQVVSSTLTQSGKTFSGFVASFTYSDVTDVSTLQTSFGSSDTPLLTLTADTGPSVLWSASAFAGFLDGLTSHTFDNLRQSSTTNSSTRPYYLAGDCYVYGGLSRAVSAKWGGGASWEAAGLVLS